MPIDAKLQRAGDLSFQPSELMKIGLPVFLAWYLGRDPERARSFKRGFLPAAGAYGGMHRYLRERAADG